MDLDQLPPHTPRHMDTPQARSAREVYEQGFHAGAEGMPLPANATPIYRQAWTAGVTKHRALKGEVISAVVQASRCKKCQSVTWGHRAGCKCWPGGMDMRALDVAGYCMEWGMLVTSVSSGKGSPNPDHPSFMSREELLAARDRGIPIVDSTTGKPLLVKDA